MPKGVEMHHKRILYIFLLLVSVGILLSVDRETQRYLPGKLPDGFTLARQPEFYGTSDKPLENGNIYDFMNGGGVVYEKYGYRELIHIKLIDDNKNSITLSIFNMGTTTNSAAALAESAICPEGYTVHDIGIKAKTYRYEPDFYLYFTKDKFLVYLAVNNDRLAETLTVFAAEIYQNLR